MWRGEGLRVSYIIWKVYWLFNINSNSTSTTTVCNTCRLTCALPRVLLIAAFFNPIKHSQKLTRLSLVWTAKYVVPCWLMAVIASDPWVYLQLTHKLKHCWRSWIEVVVGDPQIYEKPTKRFQPTKLQTISKWTALLVAHVNTYTYALTSSLTFLTVPKRNLPSYCKWFDIL